MISCNCAGTTNTVEIELHTPNEEFLNYFRQWGEVEEGGLATDRVTGKSRGYGFITLKHVASAQAALAEPQKQLGGRTININLAVEGRRARGPGMGRAGPAMPGYPGATPQWGGAPQAVPAYAGAWGGPQGAGAGEWEAYYVAQPVLLFMNEPNTPHGPGSQPLSHCPLCGARCARVRVFASVDCG